MTVSLSAVVTVDLFTTAHHHVRSVVVVHINRLDPSWNVECYPCGPNRLWLEPDVSFSSVCIAEFLGVTAWCFSSVFSAT